MPNSGFSASAIRSVSCGEWVFSAQYPPPLRTLSLLVSSPSSLTFSYTCPRRDYLIIISSSHPIIPVPIHRAHHTALPWPCDSSNLTSSNMSSIPHSVSIPIAMPDASRVHVHPHSAHLEQAHTPLDAEDDEHDYESLPVGYGWGVNMAAGAMVSICLLRSARQLPSVCAQRGVSAKQPAVYVCAAVVAVEHSRAKRDGRAWLHPFFSPANFHRPAFRSMRLSSPSTLSRYVCDV